MQAVFRAMLAVGTAAALVGTALAQQGLRGPGVALGGFNLIAEPAVRKELNLSEAQAKQADAVAAKMARRFQTDMAKLKGLSTEEQMKRLPTVAGPHYDEGMKALRGFLKPEQLDRFDQILFQQRGAVAMLEPEIAKVLRLTNDQARKVAELVADARNQQSEAAKTAKAEPKAVAPKMQAIAKDLNSKAVALLSDDQKKAWDRLTGLPFDPKVHDSPERPSRPE